MSTTTIIILCIAIVAIGLVAWTLVERRRRMHASRWFGPEYDRLCSTEGPRRATSILEAREKRLANLHIRELSPEEQNRLSAEWRSVEQRFVDDPNGSVIRADALVNEAMRSRGFPISNFEQQAEDLSVAHPDTLKEYRAAHEIAQAAERRQAGTEDLRIAMQHYRTVIEDVSTCVLKKRPERPERIEVR